jgi:hydrogenase-4 component F
MLLAILIIPLLAGLLCLATRSRAVWEGVHVAAFTVIAGLAAAIAWRVADAGTVTALGGFLRADAFSALVLGLTAFVALVCSVYAVGYFRRESRDRRVTKSQLLRYYTLTPLFAATMLFVPLADSLGVMWVAIEAGTLSSVLLVTFYNQKTSLEAGWKYLIIGSVGISLALFGTIIAYSAAIGVPGMEAGRGMNWSALAPVAGQLDKTAMRLAFVLVLIGYGTKAGLVPMHTWKPDAYEQAPAPAAALLGAGFINCAVYAIARFSVLADKCLGHEFPGRLLAGFGVASILVAAPFILTQRNFRRILAYSSIDHAGIMIAALGFGGPLGALGAVLHMVFHAATKPLLFFGAGAVQQQYGTPYFRKVSGVIQVLPWTGGLFFMATLAVTGMPPFGIFQSEFTILSAGMAAHNEWTVALFALGVAIIFAGFLVRMSRLVLGAPAPGQARVAECPWKLGAMALAALVVALGVWLPAPLGALIEQAARILEGTA